MSTTTLSTASQSISAVESTSHRSGNVFSSFTSSSSSLSSSLSSTSSSDSNKLNSVQDIPDSITPVVESLPLPSPTHSTTPFLSLDQYLDNNNNICPASSRPLVSSSASSSLSMLIQTSFNTLRLPELACGSSDSIDLHHTIGSSASSSLSSQLAMRKTIDSPNLHHDNDQDDNVDETVDEEYVNDVTVVESLLRLRCASSESASGQHQSQHSILIDNIRSRSGSIMTSTAAVANEDYLDENQDITCSEFNNNLLAVSPSAAPSIPSPLSLLKKSSPSSSNSSSNNMNGSSCSKSNDSMNVPTISTKVTTVRRDSFDVTHSSNHSDSSIIKNEQIKAFQASYYQEIQSPNNTQSMIQAQPVVNLPLKFRHKEKSAAWLLASLSKSSEFNSSPIMASASSTMKMTSASSEDFAARDYTDLLECPPAVGDTTISSHKIKPTDSLSSSDTEINRKRSSSSLSSDEGDHNTSNDGFMCGVASNKKSRGKYNCSRCGRPKDGHVCAVVESVSAGVQCEPPFFGIGTEKFIGKVLTVRHRHT